MLDEKLLLIVAKAQADLADLGKDARPSQILAVKEGFAEDVFSVIQTASEGITDAQKIAAFDSLLESRLSSMRETVALAMSGEGYHEDDDDAHYAYEAVQEAVFGRYIFKATNEFEKLMPE